MFRWDKALFTAPVLSYCHCLNCFGRVVIIAAPPVRRSGCAVFPVWQRYIFLSGWKCFVIVLLVNAFPTASFYLSIHLFIYFSLCPLCNLGSHFHISNCARLYGNTWCSQRKELENSPQCILHSFFLTTPLFMGFPNAALPAARSVPEHLHETSCRRNAHQNKVQFSRSSRGDAAAGWREAFQEKWLHGVWVNPLN